MKFVIRTSGNEVIFQAKEILNREGKARIKKIVADYMQERGYSKSTIQHILWNFSRILEVDNEDFLYRYYRRTSRAQIRQAAKFIIEAWRWWNERRSS